MNKCLNRKVVKSLLQRANHLPLPAQNNNHLSQKSPNLLHHLNHNRRLLPNPSPSPSPNPSPSPKSQTMRPTFSIKKVLQNLPQIKRKKKNLCLPISFIHRELQSQGPKKKNLRKKNPRKKNPKKKNPRKKSLKKKRKRSLRLENLAGDRPTVEVKALRQSVLQIMSLASMDAILSALMVLKVLVSSVLPNARTTSKTWPTIA